MAKPPVRLKDIAEKAGVSRMAVSHVLLGTGQGRISVGEEKTARIRKAAEEMGYVPNRAAQMMHGAKSGLIGILYESRYPVEGLSRLNHTFIQIAQQKGYSVVSAMTHYLPERHEDTIRTFRSLNVDGVFCLGQDPDADWNGYGSLLDSFEHVAVLGPSGNPEWLSEPYPFETLSHLAVDHLVETGKRRLGLALTDEDYCSSIERKQGFLDRIRHHNLEPGVVLDINPNRVGKGVAAATVMVKEACEKGLDGLFVQNDLYGSRALSAARMLGVGVPEQLAIIGQNNDAICETLLPSLTSISLNWDEIAGNLFQQLLGRILDQETGIVPAAPILIPRESTLGVGNFR